MSSEIDLHVHTLYSQDGEWPPRRILEEARRAGVRFLAFADHDSVAAVPEGIALAPEFGISYAPAVEITSRLGEHDVHVLGYFVDWRSPRLAAALERIGEALVDQARKRVARLEALGFHIEFADVRRFSEGQIGRAHV